MAHLELAGLPPIPDVEPWRRAYSYSVGGHAALVLLFLLFSLGKNAPVQTVLREVKFIELPKAPAVAPAITRQPDGKVSGTAGPLGTPGQVVPVESHPSLPNTVPYSSPDGKPSGSVVTEAPLAGPIIPSGQLSQVGTVGNKKVALVPLSGRTEGRKADGPLLLPTGAPEGRSRQIALGTEDVASLKNKDRSIGTPLISQNVAANAMDGKIKTLASNQVGVKRNTGAESLKANPFDKDKWGQSKSPFSLEGPLKYRGLKHFEIPPYPRWAEEKGIEASVSIRLWVDPRGVVMDNMYLEKASGFSDIDELVKQALMKFVFVPLPKDLPQENEWGVATFRFELKK